MVACSVRSQIVAVRRLDVGHTSQQQFVVWEDTRRLDPRQRRLDDLVTRRARRQRVVVLRRAVRHQQQGHRHRQHAEPYV